MDGYTSKYKKVCMAYPRYYPCTYTPGLWHHQWQPITFALVVDNFGVKIKGKEHGKHLIQALRENYEVTVDWNGTIPNYIAKALVKYGHKLPKRPQHSPHKLTPIQYGAKSQLVQIDQSNPLTAKDIKVVQDIVGTSLFYGRA
eukprot:9154968-Ditylum_brightwellii.AAC.1